MDSFELNKIFGAVLGTLVFVMGVGFLAEGIYKPIQDRGVGYALPEPELGEGGEAVEADAGPSIATLMQTADAAAGERLIARCQSCHDYSPANTNRVGPGIYDIMGAEIAHHEGFAYSDALQSLGDAGETWTYEHMDDFLASPAGFAPGTRMTFAGLSNPEDRANLIAFLRELSSDPIPLPEPDAEGEAAEGDEAAEGEATEGEATEEGEPVIEQEAPQADPTEQPLTQTPGAGQGTETPVEDETTEVDAEAPADATPTVQAPAEEEEAAPAN